MLTEEETSIHGKRVEFIFFIDKDKLLTQEVISSIYTMVDIAFVLQQEIKSYSSKARCSRLNR
jgi:hypothetical protein